MKLAIQTVETARPETPQFRCLENPQEMSMLVIDCHADAFDPELAVCPVICTLHLASAASSLP